MGSPDVPHGDAYGDRSPFKARGARPFLQRTLPVSQAVSKQYPKRDLRRDAVAAVTVAALAIPAAMAYAELAGLSPVAGLYALLLPGHRWPGQTRVGADHVYRPGASMKTRAHSREQKEYSRPPNGSRAGAVPSSITM